MKHNKKRNTAFIFESLLLEMTKSIVNKQPKRKEQIVTILKDYFHSNSILKYELEAYRSIYETKGVDKRTAERILSEAQRVYFSLNPGHVFKTQTDLIKKVNKDLGKDVFNNFLPNYKTLASVSQIFNFKTTPKSKVLLEAAVVEEMTKNDEESSRIEPIDNIVYGTFVKKFNEQYSTTLREEQNKLLSAYIVSFSDNGIALKMFLNEELARLKTIISESRNLQEIASDQNMLSKTDKVVETIDGFKTRQIDRDMLMQVMKIQELAAEIEN